MTRTTGPSPAAGIPLTIALLVLSAPTTGCGPPHIDARAPSAAAHPQERLNAYAALRPISVQRMTVTQTNTRGFGSTYQVTGPLLLGDGRKVYDPADLLSVVDPRSQAAASISEYESARSTATWLVIGGAVAFLAGSAVAFADYARDAQGSRGPAFYGGLALGVGGLIAMPIGIGYGGRAQLGLHRFYQQYEDGLQRRLDLCKESDMIVPCS